MTRNLTTTGHEASGAAWLDLHFESSRPEYEAALADVSIRQGWSVLDAGCGSGSFLPLIHTLVGETGSVAALDLAPENVERAAMAVPATNFHARVGDVLDLPYADATFDCVWSANVVQYLTTEEFLRAAREARRVLKPGGVYAIKEFDSTILQLRPIDYGMFTRLMDARMRGFRQKGILGTDGGSLLPTMLQEAGWTVLSKRSWMVERWAPIGPPTRDYLRDLLAYFASVAPDYALPVADKDYWRALARDPDQLLRRPDVCYRELFVTVTAVADAR